MLDDWGEKKRWFVCLFVCFFCFFSAWRMQNADSSDMVTMPVWNVLFSILKKSAAPCDEMMCVCVSFSVCLCLDISKEKYVWNKRNGHNVFIVIAFDIPIQMTPNTLIDSLIHTHKIGYDSAKLWYFCMMWMNGKCYINFSSLQLNVNVCVTKYKTFIRKKIVQQQ